MAGTLTITSPATDSQAGISTSSVPVSWTFAGTSGATQTQRRVVSTPVGSSTASYDSGTTATTSTSLTVPNFATGVSYNVTVTVTDSSGSTTSATRVIVSNYTRPLPPVLTVDLTNEIGPILTITNPSDGSRPTVTSNVLYRRLAGSGSDWTLVSSFGANPTGVIDYEAAASTSYDYFVRANGQVDSSILTVTTPPMTGAWIHTATAHGDVTHFPYAAAAAESLDLETAFHPFVGRTYPVAEIGVARNDALSVSIRLTPDVRSSAEGAWRTWKRAGLALFYRDGRGRAWPAVIDGPAMIGPDGPGAVITATLRRVDYPPTMLPASSYSYTTNVDGGYGVNGYGSNGYGL